MKKLKNILIEDIFGLEREKDELMEPAWQSHHYENMSILLTSYYSLREEICLPWIQCK